MIPIYEQAAGHGIGYAIPDFLNRFRDICEEHLKDGRAKAFAFILYDFGDEALRAVLQDQDGFTELDRLAGKDLSVFYLHDSHHHYIAAFNVKFLRLLGAPPEARTPCVVFFRMERGRISDSSVANLDSRNLLTSFHELHVVLEEFRDHARRSHTKALRIFRSAAKSVSVETISSLIADGVEHFL